MVFKGCRRCSGDLWIEEDIGSRLEDLVCLQCGHRQAVQAAGPGLTIEGLSSPAPAGGREDCHQQLVNVAGGYSRVESLA